MVTRFGSPPWAKRIVCSTDSLGNVAAHESGDVALDPSERSSLVQQAQIDDLLLLEQRLVRQEAKRVEAVVERDNLNLALSRVQRMT